MEHDALEAAFVVGGLAVTVATALAVVMFVWWLRDRDRGRPVTLVGCALVVSVITAAASIGWLGYQRHEKCGPTVARRLCDSPADWLRSR